MAGEHHGAVVAFLRLRLTRALLGGLLFTLRRFGDALFGCEFAPPGLLSGDRGVLASELLLLGVDPFEGRVGGVERLAVAFFCFSERFGQSIVRFGRVVGDLVPLVGGCDRLCGGVRAALSSSIATARSAASALIFASSSARLVRARRSVPANSVRAPSMAVSTRCTFSVRASSAAWAWVSAWAGAAMRVCSRRTASVRLRETAAARAAAVRVQSCSR